MADPDARAVHTIDADALTELAVTPLDGEPACAEGSRDVLHVVTPQLSDFFDRITPVERHAFSLEKGAIKILTGFTSRHDSLSFKVPDWSDVSDRGCAKPEKSCSHGVRIEVSRAESEAKATVIVNPNLSDQ